MTLATKAYADQRTLEEDLAKGIVKALLQLVSGHEKLPAGGHESARGWPPKVPNRGHENCPLAAMSSIQA